MINKNIQFFGNDIKTMAELNSDRVELMTLLNSQYNQKKKEIQEQSKSFKRIEMISITTLEVHEAELYAPFALVGERSKEAKVTFNDDGTVKH